MAAVDYLARKFDVLALRGQQAVGDTQLSQSLFDQDIGGEVCTGIQMLAQRWSLEFLTIQGSLQFLPQRGTLFMLQVRRGRFRTEADVHAEFNFASVLVQQNLLAEENDTMHDEERFAEANLLQIVLSPGFLALHVEIISRAGDTRKVILPISIVPIPLL